MGQYSFLLFCLIHLGIVLSVQGLFNLTILHNNDVHSRFPQFSKFGGRCPPEQAEAGKCYGGFARQVTKVKEIRERTPNVIFLNAGDFFQGTVWYSLYKWEIVSTFVNKLTIDAMSLGNHEFDDGIKGLLPYLEKSLPQVVVCNIDSSKVPEFAKYVKKSVILEVAGEKFGVIGFLTPETKFLSSAGELEFYDEIDCIRQEAQRLTDEGISKIIVVGHSGFVKDQEIAAAVPLVDIVVGGHTNTFLYTGETPSVEEPQGPYPIVVKREDGSMCLIVQNYAFGKYMGFLQVQFDDDGRVHAWSGNPILLDGSVQEDPEILEILRPYQEEVVRRGQEPVGRTNVLLRADRPLCRMQECNMGNFLADASVSYFIEDPTDQGWNSVGVAVWNSGGIRASIDERINNGSVLFEDLLAIAPFSNTMDVVGLQGKHLKEVLEYSVRNYDLEAIDPPGSLLQVAGMRVTFNVLMPPGSRVQEVLIRCTDCRVPRYLLLEDEKVYDIVMNTYMAKGGDGFTMIPDNAIHNKNTEVLDVDIIKAYLKKCSPVIIGLEGRITVLKDDDPTKNPLDDVVESIADVSLNVTEVLTNLTGALGHVSTQATNSIPVETDVPMITNAPVTTSTTVTTDGPSLIDRGIENLQNLPSNIAGGFMDAGKTLTDAGKNFAGGLRKLNPFSRDEETTDDENEDDPPKERGGLGGILGK